MRIELFEFPRQFLPGQAPRLAPPDRRSVALCLLAAIGYYASVKFGFAFTFDPYPVSVLWPSNAVLMAVLMVAPMRAWWIVLASVFPIHVGTELARGVPALMVLCWFVSNALEALLGAFAVRRLLGREPSFGGVAEVGAFLLGAVLFATFVSCFVDAGFVTLLQWGGATFWELWITRLGSNSLATLLVVPVVVSALAWRNEGRRRPTRVRLLEGTLLSVGLTAVSVNAFNSLAIKDETDLLSLYSPLPFLLWAAVRFGPAGSSAAFALVAFVVIWGATHFRGPFALGTPAESAFSVQIFLLFGGVTLLTLAAAIEERRRHIERLASAQESLRVSDERFRLIHTTTNDVLFDWNLGTGVLWWNANGDAYFGSCASNPAALGWWNELLHPEDAAHMQARLESLARGESTQCDAECRIRRNGQDYATVHWRASLVRDETGKPLRMIGSLMDITDRKRVEDAQQRLAHVSRFAVLGQLTASVAHEINQPLASILTNADAAEIMLRQTPLPLAELLSVIADIRRDDMRAAEVIRHMRKLLTKRQPSLEAFDLKRAVQDVLRLAKADLARLQVAVETEMDGLPLVHGDPIQIQQVLLNLIGNAADAMASSPVPGRRLGVRARSTAEGDVEVTVWDCGPGIRAPDVGMLFESFYTTKRGGMGLGLAIARSIVEAHGGRMWAGNRNEGGAEFGFSLPARQEQRESLVS